MTYRLELTRDALKGIAGTHPEMRRRTEAAIDALTDAPMGGNSSPYTARLLDVGPRGRIYRRARR